MIVIVVTEQKLLHYKPWPDTLVLSFFFPSFLFAGLSRAGRPEYESLLRQEDSLLLLPLLLPLGLACCSLKSTWTAATRRYGQASSGTRWTDLFTFKKKLLWLIDIYSPGASGNARVDEEEHGSFSSSF